MHFLGSFVNLALNFQLRLLQSTLLVAFAMLVGCSPTDKLPSTEVMALNDQGVAKMGQFQYAPAFEDFTTVVSKAPYWDEGVVNLAIATLNRQNPGDENLALDTLRTVLTRNPTQVRALYTSGIINLYLGNTEPAVDFLEQATELDPNDAFASYFLGQAYLQAERYEEAQKWLLKTLELNPSMRSAYWAASTASRRLGQDERALELIDEYQSFEHNPLSVSAGFSYKQMGPKAEAISVRSNVTPVDPKPEGSLFAEPKVILNDLKEAQAISSADINGDGRWDLLISNSDSAQILLAYESSSFESTDIPGLSQQHQAAAWGDLENDGETELARCVHDSIEIVGLIDGNWEVSTKLPSLNCRAIRLADADHDGDLDILSVGSSGLQIYYNKLDGTFELRVENGVNLDIPLNQVLVVDLDRDRDADLVLIGEVENVVWSNELTWRYEAIEHLAEFSSRIFTSATVLDVDLDGRLEIATASETSGLEIWKTERSGWQTTRVPFEPSAKIVQLESQDFDGDGRRDLLIVHDSGFVIMDLHTKMALASHALNDVSYALVVYSEASSGPVLITVSEDGVMLWRAGIGRHRFMSLLPTGKTSADQMRSNASGIGTYVKTRADTRWSLNDNHSSHSGSSQSLRPMMIGSGGASKANYVELLWSDGVHQTEIDLAFGELHKVEEAQRQLASCPVVFVWNGEKYEFLSDVLGVAALGYFYKPGQQTPVRPFERILLPEGLMQSRDGRFEIKIGEPMEEVLYLDTAKLIYYDLPRGWDIVLDERLNVASPSPTGSPLFFRREWLPTVADSNKSDNALEQLKSPDRIAVDPGPVDKRFIGLLEDEHILTLEFDEPLPTKGAVLVAEGWVEFPYSQTSFSAYQSSVSFSAPTLEVQDEGGDWHVLEEQFGYPAGMPRQMALPLTNLPIGSSALRIRSNLEIYWDYVKVVQTEQSTQIKTGDAKLESAVVRVSGFARRTTGAQRIPYYDYSDRSPYWSAKFATGFYTNTGDAMELVEKLDNAVAIIGSGEEVHLEFEMPTESVPEDFVRRYAIDFRGWAKDMDLYTTTGNIVEPIPYLAELDEETLIERDKLHSKYNLRFQDGMPSW